MKASNLVVHVDLTSTSNNVIYVCPIHVYRYYCQKQIEHLLLEPIPPFSFSVAVSITLYYNYRGNGRLDFLFELYKNVK